MARPWPSFSSELICLMLWLAGCYGLLDAMACWMLWLALLVSSPLFFSFSFPFFLSISPSLLLRHAIDVFCLVLSIPTPLPPSHPCTSPTPPPPRLSELIISPLLPSTPLALPLVLYCLVSFPPLSLPLSSSHLSSHVFSSRLRSSLISVLSSLRFLFLS